MQRGRGHGPPGKRDGPFTQTTRPTSTSRGPHRPRVNPRSSGPARWSTAPLERNTRCHRRHRPRPRRSQPRRPNLLTILQEPHPPGAASPSSSRRTSTGSGRGSVWWSGIVTGHCRRRCSGARPLGGLVHRADAAYRASWPTRSGARTGARRPTEVLPLSSQYRQQRRNVQDLPPAITPVYQQEFSARQEGFHRHRAMVETCG